MKDKGKLTYTPGMFHLYMITDQIGTKQRGSGAIICCCSQPAMLRENVFALSYWYI